MLIRSEHRGSLIVFEAGTVNREEMEEVLVTLILLGKILRRDTAALL